MLRIYQQFNLDKTKNSSVIYKTTKFGEEKLVFLNHVYLLQHI